MKKVFLRKHYERLMLLAVFLLSGVQMTFGETVNFPFVSSNKASEYGITAPTTSNETMLDNIEIKVSPVSIKFLKSNGTYSPAWSYTSEKDYCIRLYANNTFTISVQDGYKITGVSIAEKSSHVGIDYFSPSLYNYTSTGEKSVSFTCKLTGIQITRFTVTYTKDETQPSSYTRDVKSGYYGSICLPCASTVSACTGVEAVYTVSDVSGSSVTLSSVDQMEAGVPYIFKSNAESVTFTQEGDAVSSPVNSTYLVGNFDAMAEDTHVPVGMYILQNNQFAYVNDATSATSGKNRCYLNPQGKGEARQTLPISVSSETGISALNALLEDGTIIYDNNGCMLRGLQKGINIVNGKTVIVK